MNAIEVVSDPGAAAIASGKVRRRLPSELGIPTLRVGIAGKTYALSLKAGEFAIAPGGVWRTAGAPTAGSALFITPGDGTKNRRDHREAESIPFDLCLKSQELQRGA